MSESHTSGPLDSRTRPASLSVVVPVYDEEANVEPLVDAVLAAVRPLGIPFELIVVDDGSRDGTLDALLACRARAPELVVVALRRNAGQTPALQAGFDRARGEIIVTMDGDLQNDPRDIPLLLDEIERGADVVSGWRRKRQDDFVVRTLPSWIANRLIRLVTRVPVHDQGCALKAYRSEVVHGLDLYGDMHRFVTVMTMALGAAVREVEVRHHPRTAGESKYGLSRTFRVMADLFTVRMLTGFRESPMRWFSLLGIPFLLIALVSAPLALAPSDSIVFATVTFLATTTFAGCVLLGLLGELVLEEEGRGAAHRVVCREWRPGDRP